MTLVLRNSMGRRLQPFRSIKKGEVKMYTCGPTVWNYAHIGNFRTFVFEDVLRRYLKFKGYKVVQVMNITDVEDKIIKGMKSSGMTRKELCDFYEKAFFDDIATLGMERAEHYPRATEHISEMVALVKTLMRKGYAYKAKDDSVYFAVSKFPGYGKLSGIKAGELKAGARVAQDHYEKEQANDFALWKAWDPDDGDVYWETELGKGRPGWHIECSAMSMRYLGESFDIHTGGIDNRFPHHENEIAQSEAATGKKFVRYWLHSEPLNIEGEEMHKSVGNVVYLRDLLKEGWDPLVIRTFLVSSRYREPVSLTKPALAQARSQQERLQELAFRLRSVKGEGVSRGLGRRMLGEFTKAMDEDLNTSVALAALLRAAKEANALIDTESLGTADASELLAALEAANSVLGVLKFGEERLPEELERLVTEREEARRKGDFAAADRIRSRLLSEGVVLEDTKEGTVWKRARPG